MNYTKGKISTRQAMIIFILASISPIIRILPTFCANIGKQASYFAPIITIIPFMLLIFVLYELFKNSKESSLESVFTNIVGKPITKIIMIFYMLWIFSLLGFYTRMFGERFVSSVSVDSPIEFFLISILALVFIVTRGELEHFARWTEVFILVLLLGILASFIFVLPEVEICNLYPVNTNDIIPLIGAVYPIISIWSYVTFMFFLGDKISDKKNIKKYGLQTAILLAIVNVIVIIMTIGVFGYELTKTFSLPFFSALKDIQLFGKIDGLESIFISLWIIADFVMISMLVYVLNKLIKEIFCIKSTKATITPIIFLTYLLSLKIAGSRFELDEFSNRIGFHLNIIFGFVIPCVMFVIGKIRKKI